MSLTLRCGSVAAAAVALLGWSAVCGQEIPKTGDRVKGAVWTSTFEQVREDALNVPCESKERLKGVKALFVKYGAVERDIQIQKVKKAENLVVTYPGESPSERIVVGAHYDFAGKGCGAIDNWSGIVALAHIYRSVQAVKPRKTVVFVAFDKEEKDRAGSIGMAGLIPAEDVRNYCAMINLDSFGQAESFIMKNVSSPAFTKGAQRHSAAMNLELPAVALTEGTSDSASFIQRGIPALTLSGLNGSWLKVIHTGNDQVSMVKFESVYAGYRMALAVWGLVDTEPCRAFAD